MLDLFIWILLGIAAAAMFFMVRVQFVYWARIAAIRLPDFPRSYHALPDFDAMLYSPKYIRLWTTAQWMEWLREAEAA